MKRSTLGLLTCIAVFQLLLSAFTAGAQAPPKWLPIPSSKNDLTLATSVGLPDWVNADMHDLAGFYFPAAQVLAVVYDDPMASTPTVNIWTYSTATGTTKTATISDARHADVVIADDTSTFFNVYVVVVYENTATGGVDMQKFQLTNVIGSGTSTFLGTQTAQLSGTTSGNNNPARNPHIDIAPDPNRTPSPTTNPQPLMADILPVWSENIGGTWKVQTLSSTYDITQNGPTATALPARKTIDDGDMPDVALQWEAGATVHYNAYFIYYQDGPQYTKYAEWDMSTTVPMLHPPVESGLVLAPPRIDATSINGPTVANARKAVVEIGAGTPEIHSYEKIGGFGAILPSDIVNYSTITTFPQSNPLATTGGYAPAVVAGLGEKYKYTGYLANMGFIMGWYIDGDDIESVLSDETAVGNHLGGYATVCSTACVTCNPDYIGGKNLVAFATCSNTGYGEMAAWYDNGDIKYKYLASAAFQWKTTGIDKVNTEGNWQVYPNPATSAVTIKGQAGAYYSLTDLTGRTLMTGTTAKSTETISISHLPQGMYLLQLKAGAEITTVRLVKQ